MTGEQAPAKDAMPAAAGRRMRAVALTGYAEVCADLGLDWRRMLDEFEIDERALADPEMSVPADRILRLLEASAEASGCETFGLRMSEHRVFSQYGPIALLLVHQPTMRDVLQCMIRRQRMINDATVLDVEDFPDGLALVRSEFLAGPEVRLRQAYEHTLGLLVRTFSDPHRPMLRPQMVHFSHGPPADLSVHRRVFGSSVEFNAMLYGITCRREDLDAPNPSANAALAAHAEAYVRTLPFGEAEELATDVERAIHVLLPFDGASIPNVAARLGLSARTLQRRLAEENADFSLLLNHVRREHAVRYLSNRQISVDQVAGLVGYSRATTFARWFAAEFGVAPSKWRASPGRARA